YHFDHTGGNLPLHDATIIAHDNVRKRLAQNNVVGNGGPTMKVDQPANPKEALPVITFQHDVTLHVNGEDIRALHAPSGHTDGDSIVFFPNRTSCTSATTSCATAFRSSTSTAAAAPKA